jgi:hypothetical protein
MILKTLVSPLHHFQNLDQTVFMTKLQKANVGDFGASMLPLDRPPQPVAL